MKMLFLAIAFTVLSAFAETDGDWLFTCSDADNTATITGYSGSSSSITVPLSVTRVISYQAQDDDGEWHTRYRTYHYSVTALGANVFQNKTFIRHASLPSSVTTLGYGLFSGCTSLESVTIPGNVKAIPSSCFNGCSSLSSAPDLSECEEIGSGAFASCVSLRLADGHLSLPSARTIGIGAFENCASIESVSTGPSLATLGQSAFAGCAGLLRARIDGCGLIMPQDTFRDCADLKTVVVGDGVVDLESYSYSGWYATSYYSPFTGCDALETVEVGTGVTAVNDYLFREQPGLRKVTLAGSVSRIGYAAFSGCGSLVECSVAEGPKVVGGSAFANCRNLESAPDLSECEEIGSGAFASCVSLRLADGHLSLPSARTIGIGAFENCASIESVSTGPSLATLGQSAFAGCAGLLRARIDGCGLIMPQDTFRDCADLKTVVVGDGVVDLESYSYSGWYATSYYSPFTGCDALETVEVGTGVTAVNDYLFREQPGLRKVTLAGSVSRIGYAAFSGCGSLVECSVAEGPKVVGGSAFANCQKLESGPDLSECEVIGNSAFLNCVSWRPDGGHLSLPSVKTIEIGAFENCAGIESMSTGPLLATLGWAGFDGAFQNCSSLTSVRLAGAPPSTGTYVFSGVATGARGHYRRAYEDEWREVIDANGKWHGLIMEEYRAELDFRVILHGNGGMTADGAVEKEIWLPLGESKALPQKPFSRGRGALLGWMAGSPSFDWANLECADRLIPDGETVSFEADTLQYWLEHGGAELDENGIWTLHLYAVWGTDVTVNFFNCGMLPNNYLSLGQFVSLSPDDLANHLRFRFSCEHDWVRHVPGASVLLPPGWHDITVYIDDGYVWCAGSWSLLKAEGNVIDSPPYSSGDSARFNIQNDYVQASAFGSFGCEADGALELYVEVNPETGMSNTGSGNITFNCRGVMSPEQEIAWSEFPEFDHEKVEIRICPVNGNNMSGQYKWLSIPAQTSVKLPAGLYDADLSYPVELGNGRKFWAVDGGWLRFSIEPDSDVTETVMFRPFGDEYARPIRVVFDGNLSGGDVRLSFGELWFYNWIDSSSAAHAWQSSEADLPMARFIDSAWQFNGWYTESKDGERFGEIAALENWLRKNYLARADYQHEVTLYAHWWVNFKGNATEAAESGVLTGLPEGSLVRVSRDSSGWGDVIPGTWNGLRIAYNSFAELSASATAAEVETALDEVLPTDLARLAGAIGGNAVKYAEFRAWAQGVPGGEEAVAASSHAAMSYLLGAEKLFDSEPEIRITELALAHGTENGDASSVSVTVAVKDGEDVALVSAEKVATMFEATSNLGDWNGASKLTSTVSAAARNANGTMTFTITLGDETSKSAFLRIKVQ